MTDDTIIKLARQAWQETGKGWTVDAWFSSNAKTFQRFAELVATEEREACAKVCDLAWHSAGTTPQHCASAIRARGTTPKGGE